MAIDSINKRKSASGRSIYVVYPANGGAIDTDDERAHIQGLYSDISYGTGAISVGPPIGGLMCLGVGK